MTSEIVEKMSFSVNLPLLTRATSDSDEQTPGYMFAQIEEITFQPPPHSELLGEYLARKLDKPSSCVKLKVLKIMSHLVRNGHVTFRKYLRNHDTSIKEATTYSGPPHPLLGTSPYEAVRKNAQELLEILFDADHINEDEEKHMTSTSGSTKKKQLTGLGSSVSSKGKYEGFGYTAKEKEETVKDKAMDILIKLIHPTDDSNEMIKQALTSSSGEYTPVKIDSLSSSQSQDAPHNTDVQKFKVKSHVPGRAGGGWESDEDEKSLPHPLLQSVNSDSNLSSDSLERIESQENNEFTVEKQLVTEYCNELGSLYSVRKLNDLCKRCCALNCVDVIRAARDVLETSLSVHNYSEKQILPALLIVEWFLRTDIVPISYFTQLISPKLIDILKTEPKTESVIKNKAKKLKLIIEKLQSI
ncbi:AP-4 complex accessory subunit Tepsin-like isoform X4 [Schistocerca nitens]|uniref:AP-4 complex accessory subunit Tepsin-like isoform X4 n=2 Tax=Schistocerca nitens TaxID=7011 RepID=UPI0021186F9E|nr:AP-4 complex accessory subunit Tepsin-like isoform X4 [Schistocerca nitens]